VTEIFHNDPPSQGGYRKTFEVTTSTKRNPSCSSFLVSSNPLSKKSYGISYIMRNSRVYLRILMLFFLNLIKIRVITKLPNFEQSYKGKVKTHNYINRQNQSTTENCENRNDPDLVQAFLKKWCVESYFIAPNLPLSLRFKGSGCHYNSI
jgi:hypothetical protein